MAFGSHDRQKTPQGSIPPTVQNSLRSRPFAPPVKPNPSLTMADIQAQLEHAQHFGHSLSKINLSPRPSTPAWIQPKLAIGALGDKYEREADCMAQQVVQQLNATKVENTPLEQAVQREILPDEEDELQMKSMVQRSLNSAIPASDGLERAIAQARSSSQTLDDTIRHPMEQAFGADFSGVRVHTDAQSDRLNRSIQARAFTTEKDVFFRQGTYQPESRRGQELIAHELTHVMQQCHGNITQNHIDNGNEIRQLHSIRTMIQKQPEDDDVLEKNDNLLIIKRLEFLTNELIEKQIENEKHKLRITDLWTALEGNYNLLRVDLEEEGEMETEKSFQLNEQRTQLFSAMTRIKLLLLGQMELPKIISFESKVSKKSLAAFEEFNLSDTDD
jgi:Domain of unknown function (DUF4157)